MPRRHPPPRKTYAGLAALRLQSARREAMAARRDHHAREAALALRKATPDWVDLDMQLKQLRLETEMEAMEACLEVRKPDIPILNFDLMPRFEPPIRSKSGKPEPAEHPPKEHPDVAEQNRLNQLEASIPSNENSPPPPGGKNWKYDSTLEDRDPAHDWRNWE